MSPIHRLCLAPLLLLGSLAGSHTAAAEGRERTSDLQPVLPVAQVRIADFRNYGHGGAFSLSPDGKQAVSASGNALVIYELVKPRQPQPPRYLPLPHVQLYNAPLAFSGDGKTLVSAPQHYYEDASVRFWDLATGKEIRQIDNDQQFISVALSTDGRLLALGGQQKAEVWDAVTGDEVRILPGAQDTVFQVLAFSPDGKMLATAGNGPIVRLWEIASGKERCQFRVAMDVVTQDPRYRTGMENSVTALAFSSDGTLLAVGSGDAGVRLWNLTTGQELTPLSGHSSAVRALVFTPDGKQLVSFDGEGLKLVWDARRLARGAEGKLRALSDQEFEDLWTDLAEADTFRTYRAIRYLTAEPQRALSLLKPRVQPVPAGDSQRLAKLVADLQNPNAGARRKAMAELRKTGEAGLGALYQIPENQRHMPALQMMMRKLEALVHSSERSRCLKAVQVFEQIGNDEARRLLDNLAKGAAGAKLTVESKAALDRLGNAKEPRTDKAAAILKRIGARGQASGGATPKELLAEMEPLWTELSSPDAAAAFQAIRALRVTGGHAVSLLHQRLKPVAVPNPAQVAQLIADLDSNQFATREKATRELQNFGELVEADLRRAVTRGLPLEVRRRIESILKELDGHNRSPEELRMLRSIEALESIGSPQASQVLQTLAAGFAAAQLTRDAKQALERLQKRAAQSR